MVVGVTTIERPDLGFLPCTSTRCRYPESLHLLLPSQGKGNVSDWLNDEGPHVHTLHQHCGRPRVSLCKLVLWGLRVHYY